MATGASSVGSAMGRLILSPGASPMDDSDAEAGGSGLEKKEGRKRSEGGERLTRKRRREGLDVVKEKVICEKCGTVLLVMDKELLRQKKI